MDKKIKVIIDGKEFFANENQTILEVARENGIRIPFLCFHPDLEIKANCRICVVEIKGEKELQTSCSIKVKNGMEILTNSPRVRRARKFNLELLFSQHKKECSKCFWYLNCRLLNLAKTHNVKITRFVDRKRNRKIYKFGPIIFDGKKCIDCQNCFEVCPVKYLEIKNKGPEIEVFPSPKKNKECIYCGQCIVHCSVGAIQEENDLKRIENFLQRKNKVMVAQFAPSIRTTIGEGFDFSYGKDLTEKITAGLKKIGFNFVFDTAVGADFTTVAEAEELIERLKTGKHLPMFTSCCPAWVNFVEFYQPKLIPHLTTVRSPHIILGGVIKNYFAKKEKINLKNIIVVSIMPCTAKKYEIKRKELKIKGISPVDYVLTTRELIQLFKKHKIDLKNINPEKPDLPLGFPTGAGVIYGSSGGVMESALRTVYQKLTQQPLTKINFEKVRGMDGVKTATININGKEIKVGVVNDLKNIKTILEEIKNNPESFHYLEVMACRGGCVGGGGQPLPVDDKIRKARSSGLYQIDEQREIRLAHENPVVKDFYQFASKEIIRSITQTKYSSKKKTRIKILRKI